jgi:hypothetical protein
MLYPSDFFFFVRRFIGNPNTARKLRGGDKTAGCRPNESATGTRTANGAFKEAVVHLARHLILVEQETVG